MSRKLVHSFGHLAENLVFRQLLLRYILIALTPVIFTGPTIWFLDPWTSDTLAKNEWSAEPNVWQTLAMFEKDTLL